MKKWEEDRNRFAHAKKVKNARPLIDSNLKPIRPKKASLNKNSKTPMYTQKYFQTDMVFQNSSAIAPDRKQYQGKNLFGSPSDAQGGAVDDDRESYIDKSYSRLNSSKDSIGNSYPLSGPIDKVNTLPIFKLLQVFKLQQYAKKFVDLGYGYEVYKIALLHPREMHELLSKLNLMPGHRARFLSLFEIIEQTYPHDEKFNLLNHYKKTNSKSKSTKQRIDNIKNPEILGNDKIRENTNKSTKRRKNLKKFYQGLDKQSKKDVNEQFIKQIREKKPGGGNININLENVLSKHVSKSKTRKAMKTIFPPSMYEKFDSESGGSQLPPLPEIRNSRKPPMAVIGKSYQNQQQIAGRKSSSIMNRKSHSQNRKESASHKNIHRSGTRQELPLEIESVLPKARMSNTNHNARSSYYGSKPRNFSDEKYKSTQKPKSLSKKRKSKKSKSKSKSQSKSKSRKRKQTYSNDGKLSTSAASNPGRIISSASTTDKRSTMSNLNKNGPISKQKQLTKIPEKTKQSLNSDIKTKPYSNIKTGTKNVTNTDVKPKVNKNFEIRSHRINQKDAMSNSIVLSSGDKQTSDSKLESMNKKSPINSKPNQSSDKKLQSSDEKDCKISNLENKRNSNKTAINLSNEYYDLDYEPSQTEIDKSQIPKIDQSPSKNQSTTHDNILKALVNPEGEFDSESKTEDKSDIKLSEKSAQIKLLTSDKESGQKSKDRIDAKSETKSECLSNHKSSSKSQPQSIESIKQAQYEAQTDLEVIAEVKLENIPSGSQQNLEDYNIDIDEKISEGEEIGNTHVEKRETVILEHKNRPETVEQEESMDTNLKMSPKMSPKVTLPKLKPAPENVKSSPLLLKAEKETAFDYGYSLDSKKVDAVIDDVDVEAMCQCLAHALLKHIEFSKGEVLIDDLVDEDEDIPQFSYEFGQDLRIDLDEIQRKKELERWEAEVRNLENFHKLEYAMHPDDHYQPYYDNNYPPHNGPFTYYESTPVGNGESINI